MAQSQEFRVSDEKLDDLIRKYCRDITQVAERGDAMPVIGRENEIDQITTVLLQKTRSNVVLLAGAGVGKTATFVALAQYLVTKDVPDFYKNSRVLELDFSMLTAGAENRGEFLERFIPLIEGMAERKGVEGYPLYIICIDEIHNVMMSSMSAAASENGVAGAGDIMKPYLTTGKLQVVGATTLDEFNMFIKTDPALERRFQKILIKEPSDKETIVILKGLIPSFEKHFKIKIPEEAIAKIVDLARQFLRNRNNPDKSLMVLDSACARCVKLKNDTLSLEDVSRAIAAETGVDYKAIR